MSVYRPFNAATDGVFGQPRAFCMATDGYLCPGRPRGGGKKRYSRDDIDYEELRARVRKLRDRRDLQDLRDLAALLRMLTKGR